MAGQPQPHDTLVKAAFSRPENAIGALRAVLPPALLSQLDLSSLRLSPTTFVTPELAQLHADLVYELQVAGRCGLVCFVLYEHQSTVDPLMPLWVLLYLAGAWKHWAETHPDARTLPAIIPVVLYHGEPRWTAATSLREIIDLPVEGLDAAAAFLPSLSFILDDLCRVPDEDVRTRELGVLGRLALLLLKHSRTLVATGLGRDSLARFLDGVRDLLVLLPDRGDRTRVFRYIIEVVKGAEPEVLVEALGPAAPADFKEDVMTAAEKLRQEGKKEGLVEGKKEGLVEGKKEGLVEGKKEGLVEGKRDTLLQLLRAKHGEPSADSVRRVQAADQRTLDRWAANLLRADRIEDVWTL
jgi:predicted transposase YdaD